MADEQETIASAPELETPAIETPEVETPEVEQPETVELPEAEQETEETTTTESEEDELEFAFQKFKVPKPLKEGVEKLRAEYTKATQTAAEAKKALEAHNAQQAEATEAELDARAELRTVTKTLEEFAKLTPDDWAAHEANNPQQTAAAWRQFQMLKDQKAELEGKLSKAQAERAEQSQQSLAKRIQETLEYGKSNSTGWKPDAIPALVEFATEMGVPEDTIKEVWSPTFVDLLHLARMGKQLLNKPAPTPKTPAPAPAPLEKVTGKSTPAASKSLGDLAKANEMDAFAKGLLGKMGKR